MILDDVIEFYSLYHRLNKMLNINVTSSIFGESVAIQLDRQNTSLYNYHNITRLAAIYNYMYQRINEHRSVDDIYDRFISMDPSDILRNFCKDFKDIFYLYTCYRFQIRATTTFLETEDMRVSPDLPIYTWFSHYTVFTIYSKKYIASLLQKCAAFIYIYGIDNLIINKEYSDSSRKSFEQIEQERKLAEKTRLISEQLGATQNTNDESHTDFCNVYTLPQQQQQQQDRNKNSYVSASFSKYLNNNYNTIQAIQNISSVDGFTGDRRFVLGNIYPIQTNLPKVYQRQYTKHWAYLNIVYYILEAAIRPIIEAITREKRSEQANIQIKFGKKDLPGAALFTHNNIGELNNNVYGSKTSGCS